MKKNTLTKGLFAALLLASPIVGAESRYPAADFKPVIITQDADLIAKHSQSSSEYSSGEATDTNAAKSTSTGGSNYPVGLVVLALAGFIFWSSKRSGAKASEAAAVASSVSAVRSNVASGETGVARYLKNLPATASGETGVAKYLKNLPATASGETGVARYLKNRG